MFKPFTRQMPPEGLVNPAVITQADKRSGGVFGFLHEASSSRLTPCFARQDARQSAGLQGLRIKRIKRLFRQDSQNGQDEQV
jgi:hypothetical protein